MLEYQAGQLGPPPGGLPRDVTFWMPIKTVKVVSPRTGRASLRRVRWMEGRQLLMRAELDEALVAMLEANNYVGCVVLRLRRGLPPTVLGMPPKWGREGKGAHHSELGSMEDPSGRSRATQRRRRPVRTQQPLRAHSVQSILARGKIRWRALSQALA